MNNEVAYAHHPYELRYHCPLCDVELCSVAPSPSCWVCGIPTVRGSIPLRNEKEQS